MPSPTPTLTPTASVCFKPVPAVTVEISVAVIVYLFSPVTFGIAVEPDVRLMIMRPFASWKGSVESLVG